MNSYNNRIILQKFTTIGVLETSALLFKVNKTVLTRL